MTPSTSESSSSCASLDTLIVGFPSEPRSSQSAKKSVQFSPTSEMVHVPYPSTAENQAKWYNEDDKRHFRSTLARDIMRCSRIVVARTEQEVSLDDQDRIQFIGIERLISNDVKGNMRQLQATRKRHVHRILNEQYHQKKMNVCDEERIAFESQVSSKCFRELSHMLAVASMEVSS